MTDQSGTPACQIVSQAVTQSAFFLCRADHKTKHGILVSIFLIRSDPSAMFHDAQATFWYHQFVPLLSFSEPDRPRSFASQSISQEIQGWKPAMKFFLPSVSQHTPGKELFFRSCAVHLPWRPQVSGYSAWKRNGQEKSILPHASAAEYHFLLK